MNRVLKRYKNCYEVATYNTLCRYNIGVAHYAAECTKRNDSIFGENFKIVLFIRKIFMQS